MVAFHPILPLAFTWAVICQAALFAYTNTLNTACSTQRSVHHPLLFLFLCYNNYDIATPSWYTHDSRAPRLRVRVFDQNWMAAPPIQFEVGHFVGHYFGGGAARWLNLEPTYGICHYLVFHTGNGEVTVCPSVLIFLIFCVQLVHNPNRISWVESVPYLKIQSRIINPPTCTLGVIDSFCRIIKHSTLFCCYILISWPNCQ